jgi:hypothetical protein
MAVNDQMIPGGIVNSGIDRTWIITEGTNGGSSVSLELAWTAPEERSLFNRAQSEIIRSNGTSVIEHSATDSAAGLNPYSRHENAFTTLTQFSVASYVNVSALPIKIKSFAAVRISNSSVRISWETGGDYEEVVHNIQRSADGIHFTNISAVNGQPGKNLYSFTDDQFNDKTSWYRLQLKASNGQAIYSSIAKVQGQDQKDRIELRPSITHNQVTILFIVAARKERSVVRLLDMSGKVLSQYAYELAKGENSVPFRVDQLQKGVYYLHITLGSEKARVVRLIKQ